MVYLLLFRRCRQSQKTCFSVFSMFQARFSSAGKIDLYILTIEILRRYSKVSNISHHNLASSWEYLELNNGWNWHVLFTPNLDMTNKMLILETRQHTYKSIWKPFPRPGYKVLFGMKILATFLPCMAAAFAGDRIGTSSPVSQAPENTPADCWRNWEDTAHIEQQ